MAASEEVEQAGSDAYQDNHMSRLLEDGFSFSGYERDLLSLNLGGGRFLDISGCSGVDSLSDGRGAVFGDFDNDGDLDIFLTTAQQDAHMLFRNNVGQDQGFIRITLEGTESGPDAYGSVVRVKTSRGIQTQLKSGGSGYVSHHDGRLLFGLGVDEAAEWIEVRWPSGEVVRQENIAAGRSLLLREGESALVAQRYPQARLADPLSKSDARIASLGYEKGAQFPNVSLADLDGTDRKLYDLLQPGRSLLVNLWATWCVPCAVEMPELERLYGSFSAAGVDLIGLSVDTATVEKVPSYVEGKAVTYPIHIAKSESIEALFPTGEIRVPLTALLDDRGRIIDMHSGWNRDSQAALEGLASND